MKALAEPNRRRILELVGDQERSAGEIATHFTISRPAVSQHLTVLKHAGLVTERRDGTSRLYTARRQGFAQARWFVDGFWNGRLTWLHHADGQPGNDTIAMSQRVSVQRDIAIDASPERIWELLTDDHLATRWMGLTASFDLTVGGAYRNEVVPGSVASGTYLDIDPPHQLAHTWGWEADAGSTVAPGSTIVDVELVPTDTTTLVRLTHHDLPDVAAAESHSQGWGHYLPRLATAATGQPPGTDPWATDPQRLMEGLHPPQPSPTRPTNQDRP